MHNGTAVTSLAYGEHHRAVGRPRQVRGDRLCDHGQFVFGAADGSGEVPHAQVAGGDVLEQLPQFAVPRLRRMHLCIRTVSRSWPGDGFTQALFETSASLPLVGFVTWT